MGVDGLQPFIIKKCGQGIIHILSLSTVKDKKLGLDLLNIFHKFVVVGAGTSINLTDDPDNAITINTALQLYFLVLYSLVYFGALPISIFDGNASEMKRDTQENRSMLVEQNSNKQMEAEDRISELEKEIKKIKNNDDEMYADQDEEEELDEKEIKRMRQIKKDKEILNLTQEIYELKEVRKRAIQAGIKPTQDDLLKVKKFLNGLGLPYIQAEGEAEKEGSRLVKLGQLWGLMTNDGDAFAHGCTLVIREIFSDPKEQARRKKEGLPYVPYTHMKVMILEEVLVGLRLSYTSFRDFCVMNGNDYCKNVVGFGSVANYALILKYKTLDDMPDEVDMDTIKDIDGKNIRGKKGKTYSKWHLRCKEGKDYRHVIREFSEGIEHTDLTKLVPSESDISIIQEITVIKSEKLENYLNAHNIIFEKKSWISTGIPYYELYPECFV